MQSKQEEPCPICKKELFEWGQFRNVLYTKCEASWFKNNFSTGKKTKVRRCLSCENIQIFLN